MAPKERFTDDGALGLCFRNCWNFNIASGFLCICRDGNALLFDPLRILAPRRGRFLDLRDFLGDRRSDEEPFQSW